MTKELTTFDYDGIDKDTKGKLVNLAGQFNNKMKAYKKSWMELGEIVTEAHDLISGNGKDGKFGPWIESTLNVTRQTAYRYMWAWQRFGKCNSVLHFSTEALYELSGPNVPEKAVKDAIKLADKGKEVNKAISGELIDKHTVEVEKPPQPDPIDAPKEEKPAAKKISGGTTFNREELEGESKDAFGEEAPEELRQVFELREEFKDQRAKLTSIKTWITQRSSHPGAVVLESAKARLKTDIDQADSELSFASPYCVCVYCKNKKPKVASCTACKGLGWITEPIYDQAPKALKA